MRLLAEAGEGAGARRLAEHADLEAGERAAQQEPGGDDDDEREDRR